MNPFGDQFVLSRPAEVFWAGWRSTTTALQQQGWQMAAEQDFASFSLRVAFRHRDLKMYMVSERIRDIDYFEVHRGSMPTIYIAHAASRLDMVIHETQMPRYEPVDAYPQFVERKIVSMDDLKIFAPPLVRTEELIVDPQTVDEMLQKIREMQAPEQQRIRAKQRLEAARYADPGVIEPRTQQKFHAQILSIAA